MKPKPRGLFTRRPEPVEQQQGEPLEEVTVTSPPEPVEERPQGHRDYPAEDWPQGATAPRLFERLEDWSPGRLPPGRESDPPPVMIRRLTAHRDLWAAVQRWEREQSDCDLIAARYRADADAREAAARAAEEEERREVEEREAAARALRDRWERARAAAAEHGLELIEEPRDGVMLVLLLAPTTAHPAVNRLHPWEPAPSRWVVRGKIVVARAGDTLEEVEGWLETWADELARAELEGEQLERAARLRRLEQQRAALIEEGRA